MMQNQSGTAVHASLTDPAWAKVEAALSRAGDAFNSVDEICTQWASDPTRVAIDFVGADLRVESWTYAQFDEASARLAAVLQERGLGPGSRVAMVLGRQVEAFITALATWRAGMILVPIYAGFGSAAIGLRLTAARADAIVIDGSQSADFAELSDSLPPTTPVYVVDHGEASSKQYIGFWQAMEGGSHLAPVFGAGPMAPATLMFTSGTSGPPKKCIMPHQGFMSMYPLIDGPMQLGDPETARLFSPADPGWGYGLFTVGSVPMALGYRRVIYTDRFDPEKWASVIRSEGITYLGSVPSAYRRLIGALGHEHGVSGGYSTAEALDMSTFNAYLDAGIPLLNGFGQTEVGVLLTSRSADGVISSNKLCSIVPGFDVEVLPPDRGELSDGETGEIVVRSPKFQMSIGYEDGAEAWAARWSGDNGEYFHTGDLARSLGDGLEYFGRKDDLIVTSGYNVGPTEIEEIILGIDGVVEVAVLGEADPERGQIVHAFIVCASGFAQDAVSDEVVARVKKQVGRHVYPRRITYLDELPRNPAGKILKRVLSSK